MRVCLFGTYNRGHSANRIYADAVRAAGYELFEIHEPLWERTRDKEASYFAPLALSALLVRWIGAAWRLARKWWASGGAPIAVVGFNGQLDILLLRLLAPRYGPRIVFAPLVSLTETLVEDRGVYRRDSLGGRFLAMLDRLTCRLADVIVVDSQEHRSYYTDELGVDGARLAVCHLGVDNAAFSRATVTGPSERADGPEPKVEVLYFGQYLPLHGLDVVVDAVGRLSRRTDLRFVFVGTGEERDRIEPLVRATRADVEFVNWVAYDQLASRIGRADIVLGVFGGSRKARMVIPNKVYEAAAVGRAIITRDSPAIREVFESGTNIVACEPDGASLATAIAELADDPARRAALGESAAALMTERFSDEAQGLAWAGLLAAEMVSGSATRPTVGIAILNYNDAAATDRCLSSLAACDYPAAKVLVVDNGSNVEERRRLEQSLSSRRGVQSLMLQTNLGYAGGNNEAMRVLFGEGCEYVLLLNDDTVVEAAAVRALVGCALSNPAAGPIAPRIRRDTLDGRTASIGERYWATTAWLPRSLLRYRYPVPVSYPVRGVMGCALLVSRSLYDRLGGFDEEYFAYYEEVDYCLRSRRLGMKPRVEPAAVVAHAGHRGFAAGLSPLAAYLKARNLWRLGRRRVALPWMLVFAPGYAAMVLTSMLVYALRGRVAIARSMIAGAVAGVRGSQGPPPPELLGRAVAELGGSS